MLTAEQFIAAQKANVETAFGLANKAFEGVEKVVELNVQAAKSALNDAAENTKAALAAKDPQELLSLQASLLQPATEKVVAYGRTVYDIAAATNAEVAKVVEALQKNFLAVVDSAVKNAPAGSENAVALVKSAVAAASNAYESVQKAAKQAAEVAESNFQAMTTSAVKATQGVAAKASAKRAA
jgi:phasin family protein